MLRAILICLIAASTACVSSPARPHVSIDASLAALREQFNADADKPRILMIVAPT